ncbi:IscA/HesB family protein [Desulfovibrio ferrophilus]|uniref:HesB/YadR/YfhF-family protein n=1 Tax=Desulfovibrio ferrophilus TaxID=241368 RepID=A0A2Z6AW82_9BACT|nr:IscA/HesB family protein [Desulfovibrio ferrophilus]BBD07436.1 HesB/YadR/YfhF-family protein [Desulfovibrio ferrophilus]
MIQVSDAAKGELVKYFEDHDNAPVRVYLAPGGCSGPRLSLALDEKRDNDVSLELGDDIQFVINKDLLDEAKPVKVDLTYTGFIVESEMELGGGGCGSGCGSGGCGSSDGGGCGCG